MTPKLPEELMEALRASLPNPDGCGIFKLHLGHDGVVYGVEIGGDGVIRRVGDRAVFGMSDIHFSPENITHLERYR